MAIVTVPAIAFMQRPVILTARFDNKESADKFRATAERHRDLWALKTTARNLPGWIDSEVTAK